MLQTLCTGDYILYKDLYIFYRNNVVSKLMYREVYSVLGLPLLQELKSL